MEPSSIVKTLRYIPSSSTTETVHVPLSKSVANRWLILKALFPDKIEMPILADAEDTKILEAALKSEAAEIDLGAAGTAMRFSIAYFSVQRNREVLLFGTERMHERPVGALVDALRDIHAEIEYEGKTGYPPVRIKGKHLRGGMVEIPADMSSQFLSALMLVAPATSDGMLIHRSTKAVSQPYINMTLAVLEQAGISIQEDGSRIHVHGKVKDKVVVPTEGDWSAVAAYIAWLAVAGGEVYIEGLSKNSVQGDKILDEWIGYFGIVGEWNDGVWHLKRVMIPTDPLNLDMLDFPDLAQCLIMAAVGQGRSGKVTGLRTLRYKETDRITALIESIEAVGGEASSVGTGLYWTVEGLPQKPEKVLSTYQDHRMAFALAPLAVHFDFQIDDEEVVRKSFPKFWHEMSKLGLELS